MSVQRYFDKKSDRCWAIVGPALAQRWPSADPTLAHAQHWANAGRRWSALGQNVSPALGQCWANMFSQGWASIGPMLNQQMARMLGQRWASTGSHMSSHGGANVPGQHRTSAGPELGQHCAEPIIEHTTRWQRSINMFKPTLCQNRTNMIGIALGRAGLRSIGALGKQQKWVPIPLRVPPPSHSFIEKNVCL